MTSRVLLNMRYGTTEAGTRLPLDSHIQRTVLATEETTVTQRAGVVMIDLML